MNQDDISDAFIKRTLTLMRSAEGEAAEVSAKLRKVHAQIRREIKNVFGRKNATRSDIMELRTFIDARLRTFYKNDWPIHLREIEREVILAETEWTERLFASATSETVVNTAGLSELSKAARKKPYQGKTFTRWINGAFPADRKAVNTALTTGFNEGKNVQELLKDVKAIVGVADRDVKTITRSFFMHNATEAREKMYRINPDVVESIVWVSTLDSRTTPLICGVRDGLEYDLNYDPIGHGEPWDAGPGRIHWNCRSSSRAKIKGVKHSAQRASVGPGANYKRGDNKTRTGRVRKGSKAERERGLYKIDMKTSRSKYEGWLREQSRKNIDFVSDILGSKEKARAFRDGTATLQTLKLESPVANTLRLSDIK